MTRAVVRMQKRHKRGDTFAHAGFLKVTAVDGTPMTIAPAVRAQVRTQRDKLVDELEVHAGAYVPDYGFLVSLYKQTTPGWPVGTLEFDIEMTFANGYTRSTSTVQFECLGDKTFGAETP